MNARVIRLLGVAALMCALGACATTGHHQNRPVPIEARPTPPQPGEASAAQPQAAEKANPKHEAAEARSRRQRIAADTLDARATLDRCARRRLLPDEQSTVDAANQAFADTRSALAAGDLAQAESHALELVQLARSLNCP